MAALTHVRKITRADYDHVFLGAPTWRYAWVLKPGRITPLARKRLELEAAIEAAISALDAFDGDPDLEDDEDDACEDEGFELTSGAW